MRSSSFRKSLAASAVLASSVATAIGIAPGAQAAPSGPSSSPLTVSDGSSNVAIGTGTVTFPGSVTDAAWSPDGSRIAYIDGNGNVATANASGGDVLVLTTAAAGVVRSHPAWEDGGSEIVFSESVGGGVAKLMSVDANGLTLGKPTVEQPVPETSQDTASDTNPDGVFRAWDPVTNQQSLSELVYEHAGASGPEVWILDRNTRGPQGRLLLAGAQPSIAPDGHAVAFVDAQGQIETAALPIQFDAQGQPLPPVLTKVTTGTTMKYAHPVWSPDSASVAFEGITPGSGGSADAPKDVETAAADGKSAPVVAHTTPGIPSYQPLNKHHVDRIAGTDRLATAIDASQATWATPGSGLPGAMANGVVLTRSDQFADALGGSALANRIGGPLLLTPTGALDSTVRDEIVRALGPVNPQNPKTVYLLGGEQALSANVLHQVQALGYNVRRLSGTDRFGTSVAVADFMTIDGNGVRYAPPRIMVATGMNYADALSAGAAARGGVVVLTNDKTMPAATSAFLGHWAHDGSNGSVSVYAIGGQADAALKSVGYGSSTLRYTPVFGGDRYATSLMVAKTFFDAPTKVGFATGLAWADALSGGALMSQLNGPLLLTDPQNGPSADTTTWLRHTGPQLNRALVFGGSSAVNPAVDQAVGTAISGPAGFDSAQNPTGL